MLPKFKKKIAFILCNFLVWRLQYFQNLKTRKNLPQKLLIIGPIFFFITGPAAKTAPKQKFSTTKSPLMQDWVFRLAGLLFIFR